MLGILPTRVTTAAKTPLPPVHNVPRYMMPLAPRTHGLCIRPVSASRTSRLFYENTETAPVKTPRGARSTTRVGVEPGVRGVTTVSPCIQNERLRGPYRRNEQWILEYLRN